jgi:nitrile hydratase accessory protein
VSSGPAGHADPGYLLDSSGPASPPRDNGELVFTAPWESQAFGLALALNDAGLIEWEDFRQHLISEISGWEAAHPSGEGWSYYTCWLAALEQVVSASSILRPDELRHRAAALASLPPGHDHGMHNEMPPDDSHPHAGASGGAGHT